VKDVASSSMNALADAHIVEKQRSASAAADDIL
jgi:hypothetical protein